MAHQAAVPCDFVLLADVSGSMSGPKIASVRDALLKLSDMFNATDRVALARSTPFSAAASASAATAPDAAGYSYYQRVFARGSVRAMRSIRPVLRPCGAQVSFGTIAKQLTPLAPLSVKAHEKVFRREAMRMADGGGTDIAAALRLGQAILDGRPVDSRNPLAQARTQELACWVAALARAECCPLPRLLLLLWARRRPLKHSAMP